MSIGPRSPPPHPATLSRDPALAPHPAIVAQRREMAPHPATVVQRREMAPHPATVVQRREMAPHPATVVQRREMAPHPATVVQRREMAPHPATVVQRRETAPHPATVAQRRELPPFMGFSSSPPHPATMRAAPPHGAPTYAVQRGGGAPVLSAASSGVLVQALGQFEFQVGFSVLPAAKGFIIQRIQRTANVTAFDSTDTTVARHTLTAAEIDSLSTVSPNYNGWTQYWEVFNVQSSGASNHDDKFSFSQMDLTKFTNGHTNWSLDWETDGLYSIQGVATYYPGTLPAGIFKKGNAGNPAAGCPWTTSDPATHTALGTIVGPSAGLTHTASITWRGQTAQTLTYGIAGVTTAVTA